MENIFKYLRIKYADRSIHEEYSCHGEMRYIDFHLKSVEWEELSFEQKQLKRKDLLLKLEYYARNEPLKWTGLMYEKNLIREYDFLLSYYNKILSEETTPFILLLLKAMIILEMKAIDKRLHFSFSDITHLPYQIFEHLFIELRAKNIYLEGLDEFDSILKDVHKYKKTHK